MSLLHLVHQNVTIKFADVAKNQFNPEASYAFRLTGVDAMGFLQIQDLRLGTDGAPETTSGAYWINKDLIREIHETNLATAKAGILYTGKAAPKPQPEAKIDPAPREVTMKLPKAKAPAKTKSVLKQKPVFN
jgi:hypothetical protein